jgi:hypothetical protein
MSDLIADLESARWWMSVVVAGILVNIAATYLTKLLDSRLTKASTWWRSKGASAERERLTTLEALRKNPHEQALLGAGEVRLRLRSLVFLVQAAAMGVLIVLFVTIGIPNWLVMPAIALFAVLWYAYVHQSRLADRAASLLSELRRESP